MFEGTFRIAEQSIFIRSIHDSVHKLCREYMIGHGYDGPADIVVETCQADIESERAKSTEGQWPDGYLEELAVYRQIAEAMIRYDTFLFHGSCIDVEGQGIIFTAQSGVGKSTHAGLWCELLKDRVTMVNDDKPLIRVKEECVTAFGTPYNGKHQRGENTSTSLRAICILSRSESNSIEEISKREAFSFLLQQSYRPKDKILYMSTVKLLEKMSGQLKYYRIRCNMDVEAARIASERILK